MVHFHFIPRNPIFKKTDFYEHKNKNYVLYIANDSCSAMLIQDVILITILPLLSFPLPPLSLHPSLPSPLTPPLSIACNSWVYCEIRAEHDPDKNIRKTIEYLKMHECVGVAHHNSSLSIYFIPTSSLSHYLGEWVWSQSGLVYTTVIDIKFINLSGLTIEPHPPMLHALFKGT